MSDDPGLPRRAFLSSAGGGALGLGWVAAAAPAQGQASGVSSAGGIFSAEGVGAVPISVQDRLRQTVSVKDFGAQGKGRLQTLGSVFADLADARRRYPRAVSLDQSVDGLAIQAAIDSVEERRGRVLLPAGRYVLSQPIALPNFVELVGDGPGTTFLDNQNWPLNAPMLTNKNRDAFYYASIRHLSVHGGTHGIKLDVRGEVTGLTLDHVGFSLQSDKNFECNKLLQLSVFRHCIFGFAPYGVFVAGFTTNAVGFYDCSFENHKRTHLHLRGAEAVTVVGGRFEAGGSASHDGQVPRTLDFDGAAAVNFFGVYFEATHPLLLAETGSRNGVGFHGCHFTGGREGDGAFVPYRFESDGIVEFGTNSWGQPGLGARRMRITGSNGDRLNTGRSILYFADSPTRRRAVSPALPLPPGNSFALLRIDLGEGDALRLLSGTLTIHYAVPQGEAGLASVTRRYSLRVAGGAGVAVESRLVLLSVDEDQPSDGLELRVERQAETLLVIADVRGIGKARAGSLVQWEFEALAGASGNAAPFGWDIP